MLLDELNLAGQTVLEGLNAVLDHRSEVFIPELGATFRCPPTFRVFAAQNPLQVRGGGITGQGAELAQQQLLSSELPARTARSCIIAGLQGTLVAAPPPAGCTPLSEMQPPSPLCRRRAAGARVCRGPSSTASCACTWSCCSQRTCASLPVRLCCLLRCWAGPRLECESRNVLRARCSQHAYPHPRPRSHLPTHPYMRAPLARAGALHPRIPGATLDRMVAFLRRLHNDANVARAFASAGGPWEFNLRDLLRWCELAEFAVPDAQDGGSRWVVLHCLIVPSTAHFVFW